MQIQQNVALAPLTTMRVGGAARYFARVTREADVAEAVAFARARSLPVFVLGGGSNVLIADAGFDGLVLQMAIEDALVESRDKLERSTTYTVPAGFDWDRFVRMTCEAGLTGVECLAGIPGMTGGTAVQNVGAYGQEVAQTIVAVHAFDCETMNHVVLPAAACGFGYRSSLFNTTARDRYLITRVAFRLLQDAEPKLVYADLLKYFAGKPQPSPLQIYDAVRTIRRGKGMLIAPDDAEGLDGDYRSAGSFFKNPVVAADVLARVAGAAGAGIEQVPHWPVAYGRVKLAAAWLIERAGFPKGYVDGAAGISTRHTLALVNRSGAATCSDVLRLSARIQAGVLERFGVHLEREPILIGHDSLPHKESRL